MRSVPALFMTFPFLALGACGDGSDEVPPPPPPPENLAPELVISGELAVEENTSGTFAIFTATDPEGGAITYSLGGEDSDQFIIGAQSGELAFANPPDFERPTDAGSDNVYGVTIIATDPQGLSSEAGLTVTVSDLQEAAILKQVASGLDQPLFVTGLPDGSGRIVVPQRGGVIRLVNPDSGLVDPVNFLDISNDVGTDGGEQGLLGLAFAPDFATSGQIYINVTNLDGNTEIRRYMSVSGRLDMIDPDTKDIILVQEQPRRNHNAGWLGFQDETTLIIPLGDGGGGGDPDDNAQDLQTLLGKILRIDVSGDDFPNDEDRDYAIPTGNAFSDVADGRPEIFAIGLRNPYRASIDPVSGDLFIGDVGQNRIEEINRLSLSEPGINFGWPIFEGTQAFRGSSESTLTPPVAEYPHEGEDGFSGRSVTGGIVYRGPVEFLQGEYVFADFPLANIWSIPVSELDGSRTVPNTEFIRRNDELPPDEGTVRRLVSFGTDEVGNLYLVSFDGVVWRMEAAPQ